MKFRKYEFTTAQWSTQKSKIWSEETGYTGCHVVELGNLPITPATFDSEGNVLTPAVLSTKYSVDILWVEEPLTDFTQYEVWPEGIGSHTFSGMESIYEEERLSRLG
jgi:hypothetical protein